MCVGGGPDRLIDRCRRIPWDTVADVCLAGSNNYRIIILRAEQVSIQNNSSECFPTKLVNLPEKLNISKNLINQAEHHHEAD